MRLLSSALLFFLGCSPLFRSSSSASSVCDYTECKETAAEILSNLNEIVDPCHDFYEYSCGGGGMNIMSVSKIEAVLRERQTDLFADDNLKNHGSKAVREAKILYDNCVNRGEANCYTVARDKCYFAFIRVYIDKYFPLTEHRAVQRLVSSVKNTFFSEIVNKITWIDPETKEYVLKHVEELRLNIGYPDWISNDNELDLECRGVKHGRWPMDPLSVNAEYGSQGSRGIISKYIYQFHKI